MTSARTHGFLYIGLGDGGGGGDGHGTFGNGQNLATLWGILRIHVNTEMAPKPYGIPAGNMTTIPAGNPTQGAVSPEIWDYGLRNPWRFSFDPCTSDSYIGDVGQGSWEEVDIEPKGMGNRNYGWRLYEGTHEYNVGGYDISNITMPVDEYPHAPGCSIPWAATCTGRCYSRAPRDVFRRRLLLRPGLDLQLGRNDDREQDRPHRRLKPTGNVVSFGEDNLGNVYLCDLAGTVSRIDAE